MAALVTQVISLPSLRPTFAACAGGGDTAVAGNDTFAVFKNASGAPITVTAVVPGNDEFGTAKPDVSIVVTNGTERYVPLRALALQDLVTGLVSFTYSGVTSLTVGVFTTG
jgi:hypothetical protein